MATKSGKIVATPSESKNAKATGKAFTVNYVVLEDGTKVEVGFKQPYQVGEYFNRTVETKFGTLRDVGPAVAGDVEQPSPSVTPRPVSAGPQGRTFPVSNESPEMSIIRQNALTNAREIVVGTGMVPAVGGSATKAERQQALDAVVEDILYVAYKLADFSSGQREVKRAAEMARMSPPSA